MKRLTFTILVLSIASVCYGVAGGLVYHEVEVVNENGKRVTGITSVTVRVPGTTGAATIYQDTARATAITQPMTTSSTNTTLASGKFYWYGPDGWDFTVTDGTNIHTNYGHSAWSASDARIVFPTYLASISTTAYEDDETATFGTDSDWVFSGGATADTLTAIPATTSTSTFNIGSADYTSDFRLFGDSGYHLIWDASEYTLELLDHVVLAVGTGDDYTITHDGSTTTVSGNHTFSGEPTFSTDVLFDGTYDAAWDDSRYQFIFEDSAILGFGGAHDAEADVKMYHDGSDLYLDAIIASEGFKIGDTATGFDVTYYFETAGQFRTDYDGDFINLTDDMDLRFGTGASANGDIMISSNSSNVLAIQQVVADTGTITIGADDHDMPLTWYGETSGATIVITGDTFTLDGVDVRLNDDDLLYFGNSGESFSMVYDEASTDNLLVVAAAANDAVQFGDGTTATDVIFQSTADASAQVQFDASGDTANGEWLFGADDHGIDVTFFGATASQKAYWDQSADTWYFGADAEGVDVYFNANTTADYVMWDESDEDLKFVGTNLVLDSDSAIENPVVVVTDAASYSVTAGNSGKVHVIGNLSQNTSLVLPAEAAGLYYTFIYAAAATDAHDHTIDSESDTNYFIGGVSFIDLDAGAAADELHAGVYSDGNSNSKLTLNNPAAGTIVKIFCDGTNWYVTGIVISDTVPAFADH